MAAESLALRLISAGIPVVVVKPGDKPAKGWQTAKASRAALKGFVPGEDALAMVSGHGIDVVDVDTKAGGNLDGLPPFKRYGLTTTPSGGCHCIVPSSGLGKISPLPGVGDYAGGRPDGSGRMLIFLPGSVRTKYPDGGYLETEPWRIEECLDADPDPELIAELTAAGGGSEAKARHRDTSAPRDPARGLHPYAKAAIQNELMRLEECDALGWNGPHWNDTVFKVACNLIELANSAWTGYTLEAAERHLWECAPRDEKFTDSDVRDRWESALKTIGWGARPEPEQLGGSAADDFSEIHQIFDATPVLSQIRQAAHSRMVGSGALLCYVLGRVLAEAPPGIVLPPIIGAPASLNLAFALVGKSGDGKTVTSAVSSELLGLDQNRLETGVGSGEGLMESYLEMRDMPDPKDPSKTIHGKQLVSPAARILEIDEIAQLEAVAARNGSSMMSVLRSALTGGALKSANATAERRRNIDRGTYRLVAYVGVQPELSGVLLNDVNAGTPQRFVWVSVVDHTLPKERPEWPGELAWDTIHLDFNPTHEIAYPAHVRDQILETRYRQVQAGLDPLEGHQLLTRLKVAAAVAMLHGELDITDQWWDVAGLIMRWSAKEQARCAAALKAEHTRADQRKGQSEAAVEESKAEAHARRAVEGILRKVESGPCTWAEAYRSLRPGHRPYAEDALAELVKERKISVKAGEDHGRVLRKCT